MSKHPEKPKTLLESAQALVQIERSLTAALEDAEPWLPKSSSSSMSATNGPFVRPLPKTVEQVEQVLAVARNLAARTSAPAGWNPQAPVVGFATPNPLPHQLRGGALGTLQLQRAKQQLIIEESKKRKREKEAKELEQAESVDQAKKHAPAADESSPTAAAPTTTNATTASPMEVEDDPKRKEVTDYEKQLARSESDLSTSIHRRRQQNERRQSLISQQQQQQEKRIMNADMNLSESSSSSEEDDE